MLAVRAALAALLLLANASLAVAQESPGAASSDTAAPSTPKGTSKPRKPSLIDVVKTIAPPLIKAATSKPPPAPAEPAVAEGTPTAMPAEPAASPIPEPPAPAPAVVAVPQPAVEPPSSPPAAAEPGGEPSGILRPGDAECPV